MCTKKVFYQTLPFFILILLFSCHNSELDDTRSRLEHAKAEIAALQKENEEINLKLKQMHEALYQSELEKELITNKRDDLKAWANQLKEGYGTGIWQAEETPYPVFIKSMASASLNEIIEELNKIYLENDLPEVILKKVDGTKVYLTFDDSNKLTQRMGTSGASSYLQEIFFTVFSVDGIECVDLEFAEGDHAFPGEYCK